MIYRVEWIDPAGGRVTELPPRSAGLPAAGTNAVIKLARAFRFAMDEAGVLFVGTCIVVFTAGDGERAV